MFEERAGLAGWSKDQRLYQLKVHLQCTALQVFRILPEQERKEYDTAVKRLKERFHPVDIAELKGIEFHRQMQLPEESTKESLFFLLYGRDPCIPSESVLNQPSSPYMVDVADYKVDLTCKLGLDIGTGTYSGCSGPAKETV